MQIEWLIFFYIGVSVAMAFFDLGFAAFEHTRDNNFKKKTQRMALALSEEIVLNADFPTERHKRKLEKSMRRLPGLESFDLTLGHMSALNDEYATAYPLGISDIFDRLARYYQQKKPLNQAYYAYIVKRWYRTRPASQTIVSALIHFAEEGSIFLRQNAFEALAQLEDVEVMIRAIKVLDAADDFHHPKLITETILCFSGDKDMLADALACELDRLSPAAQGAVINFLRMRHRGNKQRILAMMEDERTNHEVRIACMRYFMTNPWDAAAAPLRAFAVQENVGEWEYISVATASLVSYPDDETKALLKRLLSSPLWHVRFNAAKSLYDMGAVPKAELADVMEGDDRYAREMIAYRWELEEMNP